MNTVNPADMEMVSAWGIIASGIAVALKLLTWSI